MPDPDRLALEQALAALRAAGGAINQAEAALLVAMAADREFDEPVVAKQAADIWGIRERAARNRFRKLGARQRLDGSLVLLKSVVVAADDCRSLPMTADESPRLPPETEG